MVKLGQVAALAALVPTVLATTSLSGLHSLVKRRIPQHANDFTFELVKGSGDAFSINDGKKGGIDVECTTVSACARGLYTYLTEFGGVDIWWTGSRLHELASPLPKVGKTVKGSSLVPWRYHFNTVTFGYTTAFWNFDKWELLLDWLALRGVNLPLAWNGYEAILIQVFQDFGLSHDEIFDFLAGGPFLPWNRFGNMQGSWGGPLPMQWVTDQFNMQKNQILPRMLELGMTPILPSFTGFVPRALHTHYPNASMVNGSGWEGFPTSFTNDTFLEPFDPLFAEMQKSFIAKQQAAYGNITHFYTLDQYNEIDPFSGNTTYLSSISSSTVASLRAADPEAIWVLQGWLFFSSATFWTDDRIEAYLGGVTDNDAMLVLDLYSEAAPQWNRTNSYFGKPWVWCELHDYGGNMGMQGNLPEITAGPIAALHSNGSTMTGMGLTMEGQEPGNEIVYDVLLDQAWSSTPLALDSYVSKWAARRYGVKTLPSNVNKAWQILASTVYNTTNPNAQATIKSIFELTPNADPKSLVGLGGHHPTLIPYDTNSTILAALELLVKASKSTPSLRKAPEFAFDVTEIARQLVANRFIDLYSNLIAVWNSTTTTAQDVARAGLPLVHILEDLDSLLYTNENFLLSTWIAGAKQWGGKNETYEAFLEYQARNQITLWGPTGQINDYASKQWAGLVGEYYAKRWDTFVSILVGQKATGVAYNQTDVKQTMLSIGELFGWKTWGEESSEIWGTKGNTWDAVDNILKKWA
ncbi:alpha-N-acetylglucosaminidase [Trametopsis cervina]|nr:alpha-N-acetylglucosaminidase [Trametopsis cervina]